MQFKVGDRVRLQRRALYYMDGNPTKQEMFGGEITSFDNDGYYTVQGFNNFYLADFLELVPEEPEFAYGEEVEVWDWSSDKWYKRIFIYKIPGKVGIAYACVSKHKEGDFKSGKTFEVDLRKTVRQLRPQLTRKEIAEKFGVSEDFTLID